jgi:3-oxoadipate enol-lactonase
MARLLTPDGLSLFWTEDGPVSGPPLLLCNSIGCTTRMWDAQVARWRHRFRIIRFDMQGHGASAARADGSTIAELANDAAAVLDAAGVSKADICGLSLGGLVAQALATQHQQRVIRLVLADTAPRIGTIDGWNSRIAAVQAGGMASIVDMALGRFFDANFVVAHPEVIAPIRADLLGCSSQGYIGACMALRDADLTEAVGSIAVPTLVIGGDMDVSTPPDLTQALADAIAGASHLVLHAAHLSNIEQAAAFSDAVLEFLETPHG